MDGHGKEMIRLAITESVAGRLERELLDDSGRENGAFCLVRAGSGHVGTRLLVTNVLALPHDAWERRGDAVLRPSAKWISAAISHAISTKAGLLFVHSHPDPRFPVGFSWIDMESFQALGATLAPMLEGPFAAAVVHPHGWAGVVWNKAGIKPIGRIVSAGRIMRFLNPIPELESSQLDSRQQDALGIVHDRVRLLTAAVVGAGGLGSPIAEQLVRMGVSEVYLIDHDLLDTESNVRRVFGARMQDLRPDQPQPKVEVVGRHLDEIGLGARVHRIKGDVREEVLFRHLLDADVVFSATDTHSSRAVLNELASTYLLPVIDTGVRVSSKTNKRLAGLVAEVRVLTPSTPCLWCRRVLGADIIRAENLPENERDRLRREGYVVDGAGAPVPSVAALTVLGSGLATCAMLTLLSEEGDVASSGYVVDGFLGYSIAIGPKEPKPGCRCRQQLGLGDSSAPPFRAGCE